MAINRACHFRHSHDREPSSGKHSETPRDANDHHQPTNANHRKEFREEARETAPTSPTALRPSDGIAVGPSQPQSFADADHDDVSQQMLPVAEMSRIRRDSK